MADQSEILKWAEEFFADKSEFSRWWKANEEKREMFRKSPDETKELLFALADFWYERVNARWDETLKLLDKESSLNTQLLAEVKRAREIGELKAIFEHYDKIVAADRQQASLARGRFLGVQRRRDVATERQALLHKAVSDLFTGTEKPGFMWSNIKIADWLVPKLPFYSRGTILKAVKRIAAQHRKVAR